jgi:cytochrome b pre-mRNA-processing protein 3
MSILSRLFRSEPDPREELRALWHKVVETSLDPHWYRNAGVADVMAGRFDMIVAILALVLLRLERDPETAQDQTLLTELFVEDMDGQLRQSGVGDLMVGKHIGRLVSSLGGRIGAFREALTQGYGPAWRDAVGRNVTLLENHGPEELAQRLFALNQGLAAIETHALLTGEWPQ